MGVKKLLRKIAAKLLPKACREQLINFEILSIKYGQYRTISKGECVDSQGGKIPWYTYPALEYLDNLDFSSKSVFEFGSGNSSLYWAARAKKVISVEHDKQWYQKLSEKSPSNLQLHLCEDEIEYLGVISPLSEKFDVIIIDGILREKCAKLVKYSLAADGLVILDNADWYKDTAKYLRDELDLIEVDFHGFGPINPYTWTTSLFISREARFKPRGNMQPKYSVAAIENGGNEKID